MNGGGKYLLLVGLIIAAFAGLLYWKREAIFKPPMRVAILVDVTGSTNGGGTTSVPGPLQKAFRDETYEVKKQIQRRINLYGTSFSPTIQVFYNKPVSESIPDFNLTKDASGATEDPEKEAQRKSEWDDWWKRNILGYITEEPGTDLSYALDYMAKEAEKVPDNGKFVAIIFTDGFHDGGDQGSEKRAIDALTVLHDRYARDPKSCRLVFYGAKGSRANDVLGQWLAKVGSNPGKFYERLDEKTDRINLKL